MLPIQAEKVRDREIDKRVKRSGNMESVEMEVRERQQRLNQLGEELVRLGGGDAAKTELITRKVKEEQVVTLRNIEAKKSAPVKENLAMMEEESETKVEVQKTDFEVIDEDAVDRIAGFGAAPQEQFFEAGKDS